MTNELLGQLTIQDIREIKNTIWCVESEIIMLDFFGKEEQKNYSEYFSTDEFYKDVLNRMKDNNNYKPPCKERYPVLLEQA